MQSTKQKTKEFKGLMYLALQVMQIDPATRVSKEKLVYRMWQLDEKTSFGGQLHQFALDIINGKFKPNHQALKTQKEYLELISFLLTKTT